MGDSIISMLLVVAIVVTVVLVASKFFNNNGPSAPTSSGGAPAPSKAPTAPSPAKPPRASAPPSPFRSAQVTLCSPLQCSEVETTAGTQGCALLENAKPTTVTSSGGPCGYSSATRPFSCTTIQIPSMPTRINGAQTTVDRSVFVSVPQNPDPSAPFHLHFHAGGGEGFNAGGGYFDLSQILVPVAEKFVVVTVSPSTQDFWWIADTVTKSLSGEEVNFDCPDEPDSGWNMGCWSRNIEQPFLTAVMDTLRYEQKSFWEGSTPLQFQECCVSGFSAGAAAASRAIQSFASMTDGHKHAFPKPLGLCVGSGASMQCYAYAEFSHDVAPWWYPCSFDPYEGCCPKGFTEPYWTNDLQGDMRTHPPVFVAQPYHDGFADTYLSIKYFDAIAEGGGTAYRMRGPDFQSTPPSNAVTHGFPVCSHPGAAAFILAVLEKTLPRSQSSL